MPEKKKYNVHINPELCKSCGICYTICPTKTIKKSPTNAPKVDDPDTCIGCRQCERLCPEFAIDVDEREGDDTNG